MPLDSTLTRLFSCEKIFFKEQELFPPVGKSYIGLLFKNMINYVIFSQNFLGDAILSGKIPRGLSHPDHFINLKQNWQPYHMFYKSMSIQLLRYTINGAIIDVYNLPHQHTETNTLMFRIGMSRIRNISYYS
jgi:hypothetical protein